MTISCSILNLSVYFLQLNHSCYCFPLNRAVLGVLFLVRFLYVQLSAWFGLQDLTASFQRVIVGIGSKNSDSAPSMQIWIKVLKVFFDSEVLPSILIRFIRENICLSLVFDTTSENNSSNKNLVPNNTVFGLDKFGIW